MISMLILVSRPRFWLYLAGPFLLGYTAGANRYADFLTLAFVTGILFFCIPANIWLYGVNDYFDENTDNLNDKKKGYESSIHPIFKKYALSVAILIGLMAVIYSFFLDAAGIFLLILFFILAYSYSAPPCRFKQIPGLDMISNSLYIIPGLIGHHLTTGSFPQTSIIIASCMWTWAMHLFSAIPDIEPDKKAGIHTTAVTIGDQKSLILCSILWLFSAYIFYSYSYTFTLSSFICVYPLIPLFLLMRSSEDIFKIYTFFPYINTAIGFIFFWLLLFY